MNNENNTAEALGFTRNYFCAMKSQRPVKYAYISALDADAHAAYSKYIGEMVEIKKANTANYYWLAENKFVHRFSRVLFDEKIYGSPSSYKDSVVGILFSSTPEFIRHSTFVKYKKILEQFDSFRKGLSSEM